MSEAVRAFCDPFVKPDPFRPGGTVVLDEGDFEDWYGMTVDEYRRRLAARQDARAEPAGGSPS